MRYESEAAEAATPSVPADGQAERDAGETAESENRRYVFRGDDNHRDGPVGLSLGAEADAADIQDFAEHVLRKESHRTSRYTSFTKETKIARKFTSAADNRYVRKTEMSILREFEAQGVIKIWHPEQVYVALRQGSRKQAKQASDVRSAMHRNCEILLEGRIPEGVLQPVT
jgi:hypothetical protein